MIVVFFWGLPSKENTRIYAFFLSVFMRFVNQSTHNNAFQLAVVPVWLSVSCDRIKRVRGESINV